MNVSEIAHQVNERLYAGDERKCEKVFTIINELLFLFSSCDFNDLLEIMFSSGDFDKTIMWIVENVWENDDDDMEVKYNTLF